MIYWFDTYIPYNLNITQTSWDASKIENCLRTMNWDNKNLKRMKLKYSVGKKC